MSEFSAPFDLTAEYVAAEIAMLAEMAARQPMLGEIAKQRIAEIETDPDVYFKDRLAEEARAIDMSARIMRAAGLDSRTEL